MTFSFVSFLYPKPDRVNRVEEIAQAYVEHVKANEPGVLQYQWFHAKGEERPTIVIWETFADQAAVDLHTSNGKNAWFWETEKAEENLAVPFKWLTLEEFAGWASK